MDDPLGAGSSSSNYVAVFPYMFDPENGPVILLGTLRVGTTKKVRQQDFGGSLDRSRPEMSKITAARHAYLSSSGMFGGVSALRRQLPAEHSVRIADFGIAYMLRVNPEIGRRLPALHASMFRFTQSAFLRAKVPMPDDLFRMRRIDWYRVSDLRTASNIGMGHTHSGNRIDLHDRTLEALRNVLVFILFDPHLRTISHKRTIAAAAAAAASSIVVDHPAAAAAAGPEPDEHPEEEAQILGDLRRPVDISPMLRPRTPEEPLPSEAELLSPVDHEMN